MANAQSCLHIGKQRRHIGKKLPRSVFGSRQNIAKRWVILIEKFVIETFAKNSPGTLLNFADVDQHSRCRVHQAGKNKIGNVIATASIACVCLRAKCCPVLLIASAVYVYT